MKNEVFIYSRENEKLYPPKGNIVKAYSLLLQGAIFNDQTSETLITALMKKKKWLLCWENVCGNEMGGGKES